MGEGMIKDLVLKIFFILKPLFHIDLFMTPEVELLLWGLFFSEIKLLPYLLKGDIQSNVYRNH
jgi:hypothetical protein